MEATLGRHLGGRGQSGAAADEKRGAVRSTRARALAAAGQGALSAAWLLSQAPLPHLGLLGLFLAAQLRKLRNIYLAQHSAVQHAQQ